MTRRTTRHLIIFLGVVLLFPAAAMAQAARLDWRLHNVGKIRQVVTNMGTFNKGQTTYPGLINCEFPAGSNEEHLYQGGLWIGGITPTSDTLVSVTQNHYGPNEFYPTSQPWDTVWTARRGDSLHIPYWPNYVGVSDQDFVCRYSDYNVLNIDNHTPLYLDVVQVSHAWSSPPVDEFIIYQYFIVPKRTPIQNMYVSFWMHGSVGTIDCGDNFIDENTRYYSEFHMGVDEDVPGACDGTAISPIGFSVMSPTTPGLRWSFKYYEHEELPSRDPAQYHEIASGSIMPDRLDQPARAHILVSLGPFNPNVGDTVQVEMAEILGFGLPGLLKNAQYLGFLKSKGFRVPSPPPTPTLVVQTSNHEVLLDWTPTNPATNPELYFDPYRGDTITRPFEGYRLYRSTRGLDGPWSLLAEYDVSNDGIGYDTGLEYAYTDVGLLNNIEYFYALTAYSKPDASINFPSQETSRSANAVVAVPGTAPPSTVGKVAVVPNPYRGDVAYGSYNPPWEKPQGDRPWWMEQDRRIQFINLPEECEVRIFTLAGDLVFTIYHSSPVRGYEDWNLTSSVGQAVASGIYVFAVEDKKNSQVQVGKFVIIK